MIKSAAVGGDLGFNGLTLDADELSIFAAVHAEWDAAAARCEEHDDAPCDCDAADFLSGEIASLVSADRAHRSTSTVLISEIDDCGPLGCLGRGIVDRWGCSIGWLSVHPSLQNNYKIISMPN